MDRRQLMLGIAVLLAMVGLWRWNPYPVETLRLSYFDTLQRIAPRDYEPVGVRVVDVDEASLSQVGQWPWPRDVLAELVQKLAGYGAAVVAFDVILAEPDRYSPAQLIQRDRLSSLQLPDGVARSLQSIDFDVELARSFETVPVVLGTARSNADDAGLQSAVVDVVDWGEGLMKALPPLGKSTPIVPVLKAAAAGVGGINVAPYADVSIVRSVPLVWNTGEGAMPGLALEALRLALQQDAFILWPTEDNPGEIDAVGIGEFDVPTQGDGLMWVRYRYDHPDLYVSAADVLNGAPDDPGLRGALEGHIIFIGTSAAGLFDIRTTALGETVPGVSIHAQIVEQILSGQFLTRSGWVQGAEILTLLIVALLVGHRMFRSGPALSFATGFAFSVLLAAASWLAYTQYNLLVDASYPLVAGFIGFAIVAGYQFIVSDRDKREMRRSFSRYVAPTVLQQIEESGYALELGGEIRPATVMFCDIRDFTPISERYNAGELVSFLNELFDRLSSEILDTQGTIDKFIGDSIMAFWNAPLPVENHHDLAVKAALGMREALAAYNAERDDPAVRIAIGISTGEVCVGNIGSADRFDYSVIGDNVNVTARLEAACRQVGCDILISDATHSDQFACLYAGALELKGVSAGIRAWVVCGDAEMARSEVFGVLKSAHESWQEGVLSGATAEVLEARLAACREAAQAIDPPPLAFVEGLSARTAEYLPPSHQDAAA